MAHQGLSSRWWWWWWWWWCAPLLCSYRPLFLRSELGQHLYVRLDVKLLLFLPDFGQNWEVSTTFDESPKYEISQPPHASERHFIPCGQMGVTWLTYYSGVFGLDHKTKRMRRAARADAATNYKNVSCWRMH
jgi:hypothetical protein